MEANVNFVNETNNHVWVSNEVNRDLQRHNSEAKEEVTYKSVLEEMNGNPKFTELKQAFQELRNVKYDTGFGKVEILLQRQIDSILKMPEINHEKKSQYLCVIQKTILSLGRYPLPNRRENHYMPKLEQELKDVYIMCDMMGINRKQLTEKLYSNEYHVNFDSDWKYLPRENILRAKENLKNVQRQKRTEAQTVDPRSRMQGGMIPLNRQGIKESSDKKLDYLLGEAYTKFDLNPSNLNFNYDALFGFVEESVTNSHSELVENNTELDKIVQETFSALVRRVYEIGYDIQQRRALEQGAQKQNDLGGRTL